MKLTVSGILVLAVLTANAGNFDKVGIYGGFNLPLSTETSSSYGSGFFIEPFIRYEPSENLRLEISGGVAVLGEDNSWSESHLNSSISANEKSITMSLKAVQGNSFFAVGISNVWRHFTATTTEYSCVGSYTIEDEYNMSDIGYMLGTGVRISSFVDLLLQARLYSKHDVKFLLGVGFGIPLGEY